ncbi:MAG: DNA-protecting protein DprA [Armatimonadetes bacterium]|nr:DNA-protecting protein DprA [Armatimonadota bacterium]
MRLSSERLAQIALLWSEAVGPAGLKRLMASFGSAERVLRATIDELLSPDLRLRRQQAELIVSLRHSLGDYEKACEACYKRYVHLLFAEDAGFPPPLREIPNAPALLTAFGAWLPTDDPGIAIVGTRMPTPEGIRTAWELARVCGRHRITVVSGLAHGVDRAAHEGALAAGGRTLAVIGSGLLRVSPKAPEDLEARIAGSGAIFSEYAPKARVNAAHLMARNRLTSGLARAVVVVQARARGGALVTADYARRQGRVVAAVPWPEDLPEGVGCHLLLEAGARPLRGPDDLSELIAELRQGLGRGTPPAEQLNLLND